MTDIRPLESSDRRALASFLEAVPEGDRMFFKEDVLDDAVIDAWVGDPRARRLIAVDGAVVVGIATVIRGIGWSAHVGELRVVVASDQRGRGLGRRLAQRGLQEALAMRLRKVVVEAVAGQDSTIQLFADLGFAGEALLCDHVCDRNGRFQDLMILAHNVDDNLSHLELTGVAEAIS